MKAQPRVLANSLRLVSLRLLLLLFVPLLLASLLFAPLPAMAAGKLGPLKPAAAPLQLLAGRLTIRMPAGARLEARRHSIMAAPEASEDESRVVLDAGKERLVLMVNEIFALAGPAFEETVKKEAAGEWTTKEQSFSVEKLSAKGLQVLALVPSGLKVKGDAAMVMAVYVASPDGTVQLLRFFVNPEGAKDPKGVSAMVRGAVATVAPGTRKLQSSGGTRRLAGYVPLEVKLPKGYLATLQQGPDFQVHHLRKLSPMGQPPLSLGVYIGAHPNFQHRQAKQGASVTPRPGKLLGKKTSWQEWTIQGPAGKTRTMREAIVEVEKDLRAHVFFSGASAGDLKELQGIADSLRAVKK